MQTKQSPEILGRTPLTLGAAALMIAAGMIHLVIAPQHWSHAPAHGGALALAGIMEIAWGVVFWRAPSALMSRLGLLTGVGLITLWAITRVAPAPFGHGPEAIDAWGVISKICEGLGAAALVPLAASAGEAKTRWRAVTALAAAAVIGAWATYGVAVAAEPFFPAHQSATTDHHQGHSDEHHSDHHQGH